MNHVLPMPMPMPVPATTSPGSSPTASVDRGQPGHGLFVRVAGTVVDQLAHDLTCARVGIAVTDTAGRVLARSVLGAFGGNGSEQLPDSPRSCRATTDIIDPVGGVLGAVELTSSREGSYELMLVLAKQTARHIGDRMVDRASLAQRTLLERFVHERRRFKGPLVSVNEQELITNAAAARLVGHGDHDRLWAWARAALARGEGGGRELTVGAGVREARCEPVYSGTELVGAVIFLAPGRPPSRERPGLMRGSESSTVGWSSLRESELSMAHLVAEGLTNRAIAARLFLSPHTVDIHLRQIYRKLGIASRVDLTRLVVEHSS